MDCASALVAILALPGCGSLPRLVGDEVEIVLDGTSEFAADAIQLAKVDVAEVGVLSFSVQ